MAVSWSSVDAAEVAFLGGYKGESPQESYHEDGTYSAEMLVTCPWTDRNALVQDAAGVYYPHAPATKARLFRASIRGTGGTYDASGLMKYDWAIVKLLYSTLAPWPTVGYKFVTEELRGFVEGYPVANDNLRWQSATGTRVEENAGVYKMVSGLLYNVTYYHVLVPSTAILTLKDGCNATTLNTISLGLSFAPETVWYRDSFLSRTIEIGGGPDFKVWIGFVWRPASWNYHWQPGYGWQPIFNFNTGSQVIFHEPVNLQLLL